MISRIRFKLPRSAGEEPETLSVTPVTVFVGPNNSGKSRVLQELHRICTTGERHHSDAIIDSVEFLTPTEPEVSEFLKAVLQEAEPAELDSPGNAIVGRWTIRQQVPKDQLVVSMQDPNANVAQFCRWYLAHRTTVLDSRGRVGVLNNQPPGDLKKPPQNTHAVLFRDRGRRMEVRRILHEAFGLHFVVDPTNLGQLVFRLSVKPPADDNEEVGIGNEAIGFHKGATEIATLSDGVKAFTGIVVEIVAGNPNLVLIDEPEAFLHPSLSYKLGKEMARASATAGKRLFASTHNPEFLMGCLQTGVPVNIVRLTYRGGVGTARVLASGEVLALLRDPLLRSTKALAGLFYDCVVVTEADADRAFYQEINDRLLEFAPERGIPHCLFLNAQNWQTMHKLIRPLRDLGVPTAGIADIDVLKDGGTNWTNLLRSVSVPDNALDVLSKLRSPLALKFEHIVCNLKEGGINLLSESDRRDADQLLNGLAENGLFVVPEGELEQWLKNLGVSGHGPSWLMEVFGKMGDNPSLPSYLKPATGDVWSFVERIARWRQSRLAGTLC